MDDLARRLDKLEGLLTQLTIQAKVNEKVSQIALDKATEALQSAKASVPPLQPYQDLSDPLEDVQMMPLMPNQTPQQALNHIPKMQVSKAMLSKEDAFNKMFEDRMFKVDLDIDYDEEAAKEYEENLKQ